MKAEATVCVAMAASEKYRGVRGGGKDRVGSLGVQGRVERWYPVRREKRVLGARTERCGGEMSARRWRA
jgi:hypothetical protein